MMIDTTAAMERYRREFFALLYSSRKPLGDLVRRERINIERM
jgi:hypothetical protein